MNRKRFVRQFWGDFYDTPRICKCRGAFNLLTSVSLCCIETDLLAPFLVCMTSAVSVVPAILQKPFSLLSHFCFLLSFVWRGCQYVCTHIFVYIYIYIYKCVYICVYVCVCIYIYIYMGTLIYIHMCVCVDTHIYIYISLSLSLFLSLFLCISLSHVLFIFLFQGTARPFSIDHRHFLLQAACPTTPPVSFPKGSPLGMVSAFLSQAPLKCTPLVPHLPPVSLPWVADLSTLSISHKVPGSHGYPMAFSVRFACHSWCLLLPKNTSTTLPVRSFSQSCPPPTSWPTALPSAPVQRREDAFLLGGWEHCGMAPCEQSVVVSCEGLPRFISKTPNP